jgi:hypothetical protein
MPCKPKLVPARDDDRREPANGLIAHSEASFVAGTLRCAARLVRGTIKTHGSESNPRRISDRVSIRRGLAPEPRKKIQTRIVVRRSTQMTADRIRSDQIRFAERRLPITLRTRILLPENLAGRAFTIPDAHFLFVCFVLFVVKNLLTQALHICVNRRPLRTNLLHSTAL